ncbi:type II toxin-antitoxin system RelE/ParE family toxin [Altericista sp. CCNU0014]|uniref:type II toxin-antitoxin system RelE/ParE family toxin n=1 Tax=Altericista sp. CCNU0014 TaxID=3082949 RepID=UPI00384C0D8D
MPIVWLSVAVQDVLRIRTYIADRDPSSAKDVALRIDKSVNLLATMPNVGRPGRIFGTRELAVQKTPFLVVYRVQNERVEVLRVLHGRQDFPDAL